MLDPPATGSSSLVVEGTRRERVVVRKRRPRGPHRSRNWSARASRRRAMRNAVVCVGVLLLMAAGLYLGLSRQENVPGEGAGNPVVVYTYRV
jgi:hypothetical protein